MDVPITSGGTNTPTPNGQPETKTGYAPIHLLPLSQLKPCPDNDVIYGPIRHDDPDFRKFAASVRKEGVLTPILISTDYHVISGHRRLEATRLAGRTHIKCQIEQLTYRDDRARFLELLVTHNRSRVKTADTLICEAVFEAANRADAHRRLIEHRKGAARSKGLDDVSVPIPERARKRSKISPAKTPMLRASQLVIDGMRDFWPLTTRLVHYGLLNDPPLKHASKPGSRYLNDQASYNNLCDLLLRARIEGSVSWDAIDDETRPVYCWDVHSHVGTYVEAELETFLRNYWRNLQQSQPCHIEIVGEKNTIASIIRPVAMEYTIPMTLGRGYSSGPPRQKMVRRFQQSGKEMLVIVVVSDSDPEGENIPEAFAQSIRDDFGIERDRIRLVPAALTRSQAIAYDLPGLMTAKEKSSRRKGFEEKHGEGAHVHELEALRPLDLQSLLRDAIEEVMDIDAYHREQEAEKNDAARLDEIRLKAIQAMAPLLKPRN